MPDVYDVLATPRTNVYDVLATLRVYDVLATDSYPLRTSLSFGHIKSALDRPPRGALAHFDRHARLMRWRAQGGVGVHVVFQLHQEFAQHIAAEELVIRGAPKRDALLRL
jgi:hypothetical protein